MPSALVYHPDPSTSKQLQAEMEANGWSLDVCEGMLQMLRLIEKDEYEIVVLNVSNLNMEVCTLLGTIKALQKKPRILLNLAESMESIPPTPLALDYPVIRGTLTREKLMEAAEREP